MSQTKINNQNQTLYRQQIIEYLNLIVIHSSKFEINKSQTIFFTTGKAKERFSNSFISYFC